MAFKFIVLFSILAAANAGHLTPGYVSYEPTVGVAKTVEYAAPVAKTIEYAAAPVTKAIYQPSPVYAKTLFQPEPYNYHAEAHAY
ncbi:uncharacterized protein LOC116350136, partial [Contarinia nasturtii]|uniref:uncharacterized protein LOC116350136 n=1 Tax=Contarinia nasturtii TaxID=265458 RepID=UPI0012D48087